MLGPQRVELTRQRGQRVGSTGEDDQARAFASEVQGDPATDALRRAGHDHDAIAHARAHSVRLPAHGASGAGPLGPRLGRRRVPAPLILASGRLSWT